jgi:glycolate oxidase iron-sulfur subunit
LPPIEVVPELKGEVLLLKGCAMQVLFPRVHECTERLLLRLGYKVRTVSQGCCGALHAHNGYLDVARGMASDLVKSFEGDLPVIVNSAGCGSTMKEYPHLLDDPAAKQFANRVVDISEFFVQAGLQELLATATGLLGKTVTYHDACHLSHGQKITSQPRQLIHAISGCNYVELEESMTCCGSAGIYNVVQPKLAREFLDRKVENIHKTKADVVATGNPGCHAWVAQGCQEKGVARVLHTAELLEAAFIGLDYFRD